MTSSELRGLSMPTTTADLPLHDRERAQDVLAQLLRGRRPTWVHAQVRCESSISWAGSFADGSLVDSGLSADRGIGVQLLTPEVSRYRFTTGTSAAELEALITSVSSSGPTAAAVPARRAPVSDERPDGATSAEALDTRLLHTLHDIDASARGSDPRVVQVHISFEQVERAVTTGTLERPLRVDHRDVVYLTVRAIAKAGSQLSVGHYTPATTGSAGALDGTAIGREAAARALQGLGARPAPVGRIPVVVGPGRGMVMIHEACCHPLEGDEVLRGSVYAGRLGERIASPLVSIADDALDSSAIGGHAVDDEGSPGCRTSLIEDGRLVGFITDRLSAARLGRPATGNGRAPSFREHPLPRMTNTSILPGTASQEDIIADTEFGIFAQNVGGGQVIEATGDFVFRLTNGFIIRNGRICEPITETTLAGNGQEVLRAIDAVGADVATGAAKCGKAGQLLPVGVVGPTLRVGSLLVGGTR